MQHSGNCLNIQVDIFHYIASKNIRASLLKNPIHIISYNHHFVAILESPFFLMWNFVVLAAFRRLGRLLGLLGICRLLYVAMWLAISAPLPSKTNEASVSLRNSLEEFRNEKREGRYIFTLTKLHDNICMHKYVYVCPSSEKNTKPTWYVNFVCYYMYGIKMN